MGITPDPDLYRVAVGLTEVVCAILLYLGRKDVSYYVSWVFVGIMIGALYTHYALYHPLGEMTAASVCLLLSAVRIMAMSETVKIKIG